LSLFTTLKNAIRRSKDDIEIHYQNLNRTAQSKLSVSRTDIINHIAQIIKITNPNPRYLEIGVRNPDDNFNKVKINEKYSVDPGLEYLENPVDFQLTSDQFFTQMSDQDFILFGRKFDLIFIDGLHKASQVKRDIENSLQHITANGLIILHDCNPPTEWHARDDYSYKWTPASHAWNGTTWKAFVQARYLEDIQSCCVDNDWGVGIISRAFPLGKPTIDLDDFFEYEYLEENRKHLLGLVSFEELKGNLEIL